MSPAHAEDRSTLRRIVSGGQTGVDRAALDTAADLGLTRAGWCPKGRWAEDDPIPASYPLRETPSDDVAQRTEWNVRDSDGTLVLLTGEPGRGTLLTIRLAREMKRPLLVVDLDASSSPPSQIRDWLISHAIETLNVAGPRESERPGIGARARAFLLHALPTPAGAGS